MKRLNLTKKKAVAAGLVTAALLVLTGAAVRGAGMNGTCLAIALLLGLGAGVFCLLPVNFGGLSSVFLAVVLPFASLCCLEYYTHVPEDLTVKILILNLLFFWILYGLMTFIFGSIRTGYCAATLVPMLFGLTNYFVVKFRGTPIVPWDLLSIRTAVSVTDSYSFTVEWKTAFVLMGFVWIMLLASKSTVRFKRKSVRLSALAVFAVCMAVYIGQIQKSSVQSFFGMDTTLFTLNVLYRNNGIAAAFLGNLRFLNIEEPEGYSAAKVEEIQARMEKEHTAEALKTQSPNVVVIMNEAFSDLSVWGDFAVSEEVMPFFKSLQEEAVGGEVYVSVKGGNTANTEFEFLTGDTMGFLPTGSIPYQQYINEKTPSLASYLKGLGYQTLAIHPYNTSGWDRDEVYEYFGFDEFLGIKSFDNPLKYRGYVSDKAAFEKIIEQYELKQENDRMFIFEVTMQNHGGYSKETPDFQIYLRLPEVENRTLSVTATEKYLTLMNQTDRALEELVTYFRKQDEPVILLMFGDHQPSDYITNVIQRITGAAADDSLEGMQTGYRVPFVMWSNYGLEHTYYDGISVNYLSGILMEQAGIPLTDYQEYLAELMETLPVISGNAYRDSEGTFYSYSEDAYSDLLNEYQILQYNHLVDTGDRVDGFFGG